MQITKHRSVTINASCKVYLIFKQIFSNIQIKQQFSKEILSKLSENLHKILRKFATKNIQLTNDNKPKRVFQIRTNCINVKEILHFAAIVKIKLRSLRHIKTSKKLKYFKKNNNLLERKDRIEVESNFKFDPVDILKIFTITVSLH